MLPSLLIALLALSPLHAACDTPASTSAVQAQVERAEATYAGLDVPAFQAATDTLLQQVDCLREPVPRYLAASIHRVVGLRAFVDRQPERSTRAFAAARSIEPAYSFPEALVPAGNPILVTYAAIPIESGGTAPIPPLADGHYLFDGRPGEARPTGWPVVFQRVDGAGKVQASAYVWQDEPLPGVLVVAVAPPTTPPSEPLPVAPAAPAAKQHPRWGLLTSGGAALVAAGALYAVASHSHDAYYDTETAAAEKPGLRTTTNTCFVGSLVLGAAGLGLGTTAFLTVRW